LDFIRIVKAYNVLWWGQKKPTYEQAFIKVGPIMKNKQNKQCKSKHFFQIVNGFNKKVLKFLKFSYQIYNLRQLSVPNLNKIVFLQNYKKNNYGYI
jgi:hypothetical protein